MGKKVKVNQFQSIRVDPIQVGTELEGGEEETFHPKIEMLENGRKETIVQTEKIVTQAGRGQANFKILNKEEVMIGGKQIQIQRNDFMKVGSELEEETGSIDRKEIEHIKDEYGEIIERDELRELQRRRHKVLSHPVTRIRRVFKPIQKRYRNSSLIQ